MDLGFLQFKSMANLCTKIEIYLGRTPDFQNEVQVFFDNGKYSITYGIVKINQSLKKVIYVQMKKQIIMMV